MKKLLSIIAIAVLGMSTTFAQIAATTSAKQSIKKVKVTPIVVKKVTVTTPTSKDGKADMRYKVNKEAKTEIAGPTKKDGTKDVRYKANKTTQKKN